MLKMLTKMFDLSALEALADSNAHVSLKTCPADWQDPAVGIVAAEEEEESPLPPPAPPGIEMPPDLEEHAENI